MELFRIFGKLVIEDKDAIKSLKDADKEARNNNQSLNEVNNTLKRVGKAVVAAFSVKAVVNFTKKSIEAAAGLGEMDAQFDQVFRNSRDGALVLLSEQAETLGWHTDRLKNSWNKFGGQFLGVGHDAETAMDMTSRATARAADASAFYDVSLESATESLQSLLKGNFTAGGAIGVYTSAAEMGELATEKFGLKWQDLTMAQKQDLILEKVEDTYALNGAMDHAIRESDQWANTTANLSAVWERFLGTVGEPVLEIATVIVGGLTDALQWATENLDILIPVLGGVLGMFTAMAIIGVITKLKAAYTAATTTLTFAQWALNAAMNANPFSLIVLLIGGLIAAGIAIIMNWDKVKQKTGEVFNFMGNIVKNTVNSVGSFFSAMGTNIGNTIGNIKSSVTTTFNNIKNAIMDPIRTAKEFVGEMIGNIKSFFNFQWAFPTLKMPHFKVSGSMNPLNWIKEGVPKLGVDWYAKGGIMNRPTAFGMNGNNVMAGGEAGSEAILPLNARNLGMIGQGIANTMNLSQPQAQETKTQPIVLQIDGKTFARIIGDYTGDEGGLRIRKLERGLAT